MGLYSEDCVLIVTQQPKTAKVAIGEEKSQFFGIHYMCWYPKG